MQTAPGQNQDVGARPRIAALDTLRAGAILWVIALHLAGTGYLVGITNPAITKLFSRGDAGVDLFFVLSGYLIGSIVLAEVYRTEGLNLRRFWYRRWMRTLPAYYITLALIGIGDFFYISPIPWCRPWSYVVFLQTLLLDFGQMRFGWSWSLCVEELFYLCLPLFARGLLWKGHCRPITAFRIIAGLALVTSIVGRIHLDEGANIAGHTPGYSVPYCRLDGLAIGMIVATLRPMRSHAGSVAMGGLGAALLASYVWLDHPGWFATHRFLPLSAIFGLILFSSVSNSPWRRIDIPGAAGIAALSYALYLIRPILANMVIRFTPDLHWVVRVGLFVSATTGAACAIRFGVERPFLKVRDRSRANTQGQTSFQ
jgi:peptidoglycan/LPS O-acetylase OafA/YrhL